MIKVGNTEIATNINIAHFASNGRRRHQQSPYLPHIEKISKICIDFDSFAIKAIEGNSSMRSCENNAVFRHAVVVCEKRI